jgi:hypothetical protein
VRPQVTEESFTAKDFCLRQWLQVKENQEKENK